MFTVDFNTIKEEIIRCNKCSKSMLYTGWWPTGRNNGFSQDPVDQFNPVGISLEMCMDSDDYPKEKFMQKQIGKYELGKRYNFCWECWLDSLFGVK